MTSDEWAKKWGVTNAFDVSVGDGWVPLLDRLAADLSAIGFDFSTVTQVKEKYGTLRFYCGGFDDSSEKLIEAAKVESGRTCEMCGAPGHTRTIGWWQTLCDEHNGP